MSNTFRLNVGDNPNNNNNNPTNNATQPTSPNNPQQPAAPSTSPPVVIPNVVQTEQLTAEEMRKRRMEKFGISPQKTSSMPVPATHSTTAVPQNTPPKTTNPFGEMFKQQPVQPTAPIVQQQAFASSVSPPAVKNFIADPMDIDDAVSKKLQPKLQTPEDKYFNESAVKILRASLRPLTSSSDQESLSQKEPEWHYLSELRSTLEKEDAVFFSETNFEAALVERIAYGFKDIHTPVTYLIGCYKRTNAEIAKEAKKKDKKDERIAKWNEIKQLIVSYVGIVLLDDQMFPQPASVKETGPVQLISCLVPETSVLSHLDIGDDFLTDFVKRFKDNGLKEIFIPIFTALSKRMQTVTILDSYLPLLNTMIKLTKFPDIAKVLVSHPNWIPSLKNGKAMEFQSILGPFFTLTAFYDKSKVGEHYFGKQAGNLSREDLASINNSLRNEFKTIYDLVYKLVMNLVTPKDTRDQALEWLSYVVEGNKYRARLQDDGYNSASEGFMTVLCSVLLQMTRPVIDKNLPINPDYGMMNPIVNFKEDSHIGNVSEKQAIEWYSKNKKPEDAKSFSFPTQCFFLTYRALRLGFMKTIERYARVIRSLSEMQREYERAKIVAPNSPDTLQLRDEFDHLMVITWAAEVQLKDPNLHKQIIDFYRFASTFLLSQADPQKKGLPLQEPVPMEFAALPEFFIENISDFILFCLRFSTQSLEGMKLEEMFNMMAAFIGNGAFVHNPYVRSKFPEVLASFTPEERNRISDSIKTAVFNNTNMKKLLMPGLMRLFADVEHTGASNQFYEKFNIRYYIAILQKYLWTDQHYKASFILETKKTDSQTFLKYFNLLLNDANYLLDDSLKCLMEIHEYQQMRTDELKWKSLPENVRREKDQNISGTERRVQTLMLIANETVHMFNYLSKDVPAPFLRKEMVQRVAAMTNYFLVHLAGEQCQNLKVQNAEKFHFDPRKLLTEITDTYINFSKFPEFIEAVAADERSFKPKVFERASQLLKKLKTRSDTYIATFDAMTLKAIEAAEKMSQMDVDLGDDIPDEFLDPITYTIMDDPVKLPTSNQVIDRTSIERHLLNDPTDPFSRAPLTIDKLIPLPELKAQIIAFKKSKLKK